MISYLYTSKQNQAKKNNKSKAASLLGQLTTNQRDVIRKEMIAITSQYEKASRLDRPDSITIRFAYKRMLEERTQLLRSLNCLDHGY